MNYDKVIRIAVCPSCRAQCGVPIATTPQSDLQCPRCTARFSASTGVLQELPVATLAASPYVDPSAQTVELEVDFDLGKINPLATNAPLSNSVPSVAAEPSDARQLAGKWSPDDFSIDHLADEHATDEFAEDHGADEPEDAVVALDFGDSRKQGESDDHFDLQPAPRPPRRRKSAIGSLVGIVGGGVGGLLLAGYALLWLTHPQLDLFRMTQWLPPALLPKSAQIAEDDRAAVGADSQWTNLDTAENDSPDAANVSPEVDETLANDSSALPVDEVTAPAPAEVQDDAEVTPASASDRIVDTPPAEPPAPSVATAPVPAAPAPVNWPSTPIVADIIKPKLYSLDQFTESVTNAENAGREFLAGDLAKPESVREMGKAYIELCEVAERYTMTDPAAYDSTLFTQQALAKNLMHAVAGKESRRHDLNVIAARWWQHNKRTNEGILLVGRVRAMKPHGAWTEYELEVPLGEQVITIPVLMEGVKYPTGTDVAVAGVIVADPRQRVVGYDGDASQVLVAGHAFDPAAYADAVPSESTDFDIPGL